MVENEIIVLRLGTGQVLLGELIDKTDKIIQIKNPMELFGNGNGSPYNILQSSKEHNTIAINTRFIITYYLADHNISEGFKRQTSILLQPDQQLVSGNNFTLIKD